MATQFILPFMPALTLVGTIAPGATLTFYQSGTTSLATIVDASGTPLPNPITANIFGRFPPIYLGGTNVYRVILETADGATLGDIDPYTAGLGSGAVSSRSAMASLPAPIVGNVVFLSEAGREGFFECVAGTQPVGDTLQGIYVASNTSGYYYKRVFDGAQVVVDWWGSPDGINSDAAAILAALNSGYGVVQMRLEDYRTDQTIIVPADVLWKGVGHKWEGPGTATRVLAMGGGFNTIQLGSTTISGDSDDAPQGCGLENMEVGRVNYSGFVGDCTGVLIAFSRRARLRNVRSVNSVYPFQFGASIGATLEDCTAAIDAPTPNGKYVGFYPNGTGNAPFAGNNASGRLVRCTSNYNLHKASDPDASAGEQAMTTQTHLKFDGRFTDFFVDDFETTGGLIGADITGSTLSVVGNNDLRLKNFTFDQNVALAMQIKSVQASGCVTIEGVYGAEEGAGQIALLQDCIGRVTVTGIEGYMDGSTNLNAIQASNCHNLRLQGYISECSGNAFSGVNLLKCKIALDTYNQDKTLQALVQFNGGCTDNVVECGADGGDGKVGIGYQSVATSNDYNTWHLTLLGRSTTANKTAFATGAESHSVQYGVGAPAATSSSSSSGSSTGSGGTSGGGNGGAVTP